MDKKEREKKNIAKDRRYIYYWYYHQFFNFY